MAADLFGLEQQTPRTNSRPEAAALVEVLKALRTHPAAPSRVRAREHPPENFPEGSTVPSRVRAREPPARCAGRPKRRALPRTRPRAIRQ